MPIEELKIQDYPYFWISATRDMDWLAYELADYGQVERVSLEGMPEGDVRWTTPKDEVVLVEVKTTSEALGSFKTHRLFDQMYRMYEAADIPIFLPYGVLKPSKAGWCYHVTARKLSEDNSTQCVRIRYDGFMNFIARLNRMGFIAEVIPDSRPQPARRLLVKRIRSLWQWTQKDASKSFSPAVVATSKPHVLRQEDFIKIKKLMTTQGVDQVLAQRLLGLYGGSPWEALKAIMEGDEKETLKWLEGAGIGKEKLRRMRSEWA